MIASLGIGDQAPGLVAESTDPGYSVRSFIEDLKALRAAAPCEAALLRGARALVRRLQMSKHDWLRPWMCVPGTQPGAAGVHRLHEEPDHTLAVFVVTWLPGEETPPHDHATWAVIAGVSGRETQHWWSRLDDGSVPGHAEVARSYSETIDAGSIVTMTSQAIHSVHNDSDGPSVTLHVYGMDVDFTDRYKFDPEARTRSAYRMGGTIVRPRA